LWIPDLGHPADAAEAFPHSTPAVVPRAAFGLPVLAGREVAAVLEFFAFTSIEPDRGLIELVTHVGVQLGRVIERERAQAQTIDAFHDSLTHLPNRALFLRFVQRALKRQERYPGYKFAVLFIDLDGFKTVNDSMGHRVGDELLLELGLRLGQSVRATDTVGRLGVENAVARLGGDEFTVLIEDIHDLSDAIRIADRIHGALAVPFTLGTGAEVFASASIGIAWSRRGHSSAEDVLQDADIAMYRAKAAGKGRSEIFDEAMYYEAVARLQLETDIRRALGRDELFLQYQPIVDLVSGEVWGLEALVRWRHPSRGIVAPSVFIPIAEDGGTILEIGTWVLGEACRRLRAWQTRFARPLLRIAVNVSAKQLIQTDLATKVGAVVRETDLDPRCLSLELTESVAMETPDLSRQKLADLRHQGVDLAIDDFGTGHSSLSYLGQFRVNSLKIDRSFIRQLNEDCGETLVRAVLSLGSNLGLTVIAEGVETATEADHLRRLGCTHAQGFYFHRPLDVDQVERLLATGK
jgi:diguanylate cyclase (GGDEF)-like protein